ncbi:hypothetical protein C3F09_05515 [candidate division GN15 bacterium]|uniref:Uncharacterized protein n=1 Tax=candidate division GN15 bacterium TaxID=2072418 RepID=A0A855X834_9BACT|nr:MAG: hypothetical protein C3F09_05515 [candidate division GN15 bacterium]
MFKKTSVATLFVLVVILALVMGCSSDKTTETPTQESNPVQMVDVGAIVEAVAPPLFTTPAASPSVIDSAWNGGNHPLLGNVFGSRDPQTLYANINDFKRSHEILTSTMRVDQNGNVILGQYVDSHIAEIPSGQQMIHFTAVATALNGPTAIPAEAQAVIGTEVDVDYLVSVTVEEMPGSVIRIAMTLNDSVQTIFQWDEGTSGADDQTRLVYANLDPRDSSFTFKGVGYCQHPVSDQWPNGDRFCWAYNITADANANFSYRMSYFSNGTPGMTFLHSFLGGGNKDTEFALKYRIFSPADTAVCDSFMNREQVFGPNYSEGVGLITDYATYLADELMFPYSAVPQAMIANPWQ